jgi:hypothetical protein
MVRKPTINAFGIAVAPVGSCGLDTLPPG